MRKKALAVLGVLVVALVAVVAIRQPDQAATSTHTIAVVTLMSHPSLDAVERNAVSEIERQGYTESKNTRFIFRNANGQVNLAASIAKDLAAEQPDVILAITTPMAQAVAKNASCPVVFAAVTDPVGADLVRSLDEGEEHITGTSDAWPYEAQLKLIRRISPGAKRLGVLYNPGEAASQYGIRQIRKYAPELDFALVEGAVSTTAEVFPVAQNLSQQVDALFLSSDNTVISGVAAAVKVAAENDLPLYVGDSGTVEKGGLAAVSVGYGDLGTETGQLVVRVLEGETHIPVVVASGVDISLNTKAAELMGVTIPRDVMDQASHIFNEIKE